MLSYEPLTIIFVTTFSSHKCRTMIPCYHNVSYCHGGINTTTANMSFSLAPQIIVHVPWPIFARFWRFEFSTLFLKGKKGYWLCIVIFNSNLLLQSIHKKIFISIFLLNLKYCLASFLMMNEAMLCQLLQFWAWINLYEDCLYQYV